MNIVIPMAGAGSRFAKVGYTFPKPLISVHGDPMISVVVQNLNLKGQHIFCVQKSHCEKYELEALLNHLAPGCKIIKLDGVTQGAAETVLLAKEYIDNDEPLVIVNADQYIECDLQKILDEFNKHDGGMLTFRSTHPKNSFAKIKDDVVIEVAEKKPISEDATVGLYHWKTGKDYVKYAEQMINKNIRTNNEFYVCPVYNEAIADNKKFIARPVDRMYPIGTPEDLDYFLNKVDPNGFL